MKKLFSKNKATFFFFCLLFTASFLLNSKIILSDPLLNYDDNYVVQPIEKVTSLNDYTQKIKSGVIPDIQPIRDLTFGLDFKIKQNLNLSPHHFNNLLIWMGILFFLFLILQTQGVSANISYALVLLYNFHPCFSNALFWVSARKHLLSTFFTLIASYLFLTAIKKRERINWLPFFLISLFYLLSVFSHPINILWPLWVGLTLFFFKNKKAFTLFIPLSLILLSCALVNHYYYSKVYPHVFSVSKYVQDSQNDFSYKLLSLGRAYWQALIPLWSTPTSYYPGSLQNFLGMILTVLLFWGTIRTKKPEYLSWLCFSLLPLAVTTISMTNIFGSDTYILNTGIGLYVLAGLVALQYRDFISKRKHLFLAFFLFLLGAFIFLSLQVASAWSSTRTLFERAVEIEATPFNLKSHIATLIQEKRSAEAYPLASRLIEWTPYGHEVAKTYALVVYENPQFNQEQKIQLLEEKLSLITDSVWLKYRLACLKAGKEDFSKAFQLLDSIPEKNFIDFQTDVATITAEYFYFASRSKAPFSKLQEKIQLIQEGSSSFWLEDQFQTRLKSLGMK